jgi:hypothetical protein
MRNDDVATSAISSALSDLAALASERCFAKAQHFEWLLALYLQGRRLP